MDKQHDPHYPSNPTRFEFDASVANIFSNMAARSIPLFEMVHWTHAGLLSRYFVGSYTVLDIGASCGDFADAMLHTCSIGPENMTLVDISSAMCEKLRERHASARVVNADVTNKDDLYREILSEDDVHGQYDVVSLHYVVQFIEPSLREQALANACSLLKPGGILLIAQKEAENEQFSNLLAQQYYDFRKRNGYTQDEIAAKTHALRGSMATYTEAWLVDTLSHMGVRMGANTTRWLQFSSYMFVKDK